MAHVFLCWRVCHATKPFPARRQKIQLPRGTNRFVHSLTECTCQYLLAWHGNTKTTTQAAVSQRWASTCVRRPQCRLGSLADLSLPSWISYTPASLTTKKPVPHSTLFSPVVPRVPYQELTARCRHLLSLFLFLSPPHACPVPANRPISSIPKSHGARRSPLPPDDLAKALPPRHPLAPAGMRSYLGTSAVVQNNSPAS